MKVTFVGAKERAREVAPAIEALRALDIAGEFILSEAREERLAFTSDGDSVFIDAEEILEVESFGHDIYVYTAAETHVVHTPMHEMEAMLPKPRFLRISRSTIVNLGAIIRRGPYLAGRCFLRLSNGKEVAVTRTYYLSFKEAMKR